MIALELFGTAPEHARWSAGQLGAYVDLATARTLRGDLAGTEEALSLVLALAPEHRTEAISLRLDYLGRLVSAPRFHGATEARRLGERIEDFTAHDLARLTARPTFGR